MQLISIIVPIYGVEKYLQRCVQSLLAQTYRNIEVILVDDESPDRCPEMCDDYAKLDSRVKVIHKKNGGLSDARNAGLEIAKGDYVAFVDSDDYVTLDFVESLYQAAARKKADISACGFYKVYGEKKIEIEKKTEKSTFSPIEAVRDIFVINSTLEVMTWNKLYRRSLFIDNNITFPVGRIHEDNFTTYKLLYFASKVVYVDRPMYYYIQREDSIMGRAFDNRRLDMLQVFDECLRFFGEQGEELSFEIQSMKVLVTLSLYHDFIISKSKDSSIRGRLLQEVRSIGSVESNKYVSVKHKIMLRFINLSPLIYERLWTVYERIRG